MADVSIREQLAQLRATQEAAPARIELFKPHDMLGDLERVFRCIECGMPIAVGPCWEHIDEETFVGTVCGCFERSGGEVVQMPSLDGGTDRDGSEGGGGA